MYLQVYICMLGFMYVCNVCMYLCNVCLDECLWVDMHVCYICKYDYVFIYACLDIATSLSLQ